MNILFNAKQYQLSWMFKCIEFIKNVTKNLPKVLQLIKQKQKKIKKHIKKTTKNWRRI